MKIKLSRIYSFITPFFIVSLLLGMFFRTYQARERFMYNHDSDLASWMVKDIVFDHHVRLIGQLTSSPGIFIGPIFYYAIIPFYWLTNWDPIGSLGISMIIGFISIFSIYFVFRRLHGQIPASIVTFIYSISFAISGSEREVVPTTPVFLWTIWFYYAVHLLFQKQKSGLIIIFILGALVWHLNLALALLFPLPLIAILIHRRIFNLRDFIRPVLAALILLLPLILFELRHDFNHLRALTQTFSKLGSEHTDYLAKAEHVWSYAARNATWLFYWDPPASFPVYLVPLGLFVGFGLIYYFQKNQPRYTLLLYPVWILLYQLFFTFHPINLSEYYLNGLNIVWLALATLILSTLYKLGPLAKGVVVLVLGLLLFRNLQIFLNYPVNDSGYVARKAIVERIATDAAAHNYPCISVSYITTIGNNLGYRYLFYLRNLHVNQSNSGSPVYSIVYPHSLVDHIDTSFGALGLILPDYSRYTPDGVAESCSGQNSNLTDPMFGFTK